MLKGFSRCSVFLVSFIYLGVATVFIFMAAIFISSYQNLKGLRWHEECENCGAKLISILIAISIIALTFMLFGCCGAGHRKKKLLKTFLILLSVLFCLELAAGVLICIYRDKIGEKIRENMNTTFKNYELNEEVRKAIDYFQNNVECCGLDGPSDWSHYGFNKSLPTSCCSSENTQKSCTRESAYKKGCYVKMSNVFSENSILLYLLLGLFFFFQLIGFCLGLYLLHTTNS